VLCHLSQRGAGVEAALADATRLGFGDPVAISAETGDNPAFTAMQRKANMLDTNQKSLF